MALGDTMHRFSIELSDVGRGAYASLDLRVAQHPSESRRRMLARVFAYALEHEEGIDFGRGIGTTDDPALWIKDLRGDVRAWIEIGQPSAERLHKASKLGARVVVYAYADPSALLRELGKATIHRKEELVVWELPSTMLDTLERELDRNERWMLTVSDDALYLTRGDTTLEGQRTRHSLA